MSSSGSESGDLLEEFRQTADERLERITVAWVSLERDRTDKNAVDVMLRELHTLKGEAKMMGFASVSQRAHQIESLVAERANTEDLADRGDLILRALDAVRSAVRNHGNAGRSGLTEDLEVTARIGWSPPATPPAANDPARQPPFEGARAAPPERPSPASEPAPSPTHPVTEPAAQPATQPATLASAQAATEAGTEPVYPDPDLEVSRPLPTRANSDLVSEPTTGRVEVDGDVLPKTLRVDTERIARVARISAESAIGQASVEHAVDGLMRLSADASDAVRRLDRAQSFGLNYTPGPLGGDGSPTQSLRIFAARLSAMAKTLRDQSHQASLRVKELDWRARELRMVPMRGLLERHVRLVRDLSRDLGKRATLLVHDAGVAIDKAVVERISDPLIHLVRNAVDHGAERPEERARLGKPAEARLTLTAEVQGSFVRITLFDDGKGIDLDEIRRRAVELRVVARDTPISDEEALAMIFKPGFSTRRVATETSGRGVGLDVVRHEIEVLGGTVHVESTVGKGSRFELRVPMTLSLTRMLVLRSGKGLYSIPSASVHRLVEVTSIEHVSNQPVIRTPDGSVRVVNLAHVLGLHEEDEGEQKGVIVRHDNLRVALVVAGYEDELEVVTQPLGRLFRAQRLISGASLMPNGRLTLIMNPGELVSRALGEAPRFMARRAADKKGTSARILVVEDSAITRAVVTRILRALDYEVWEASDGQAALTVLAGKLPDLVLTDIDMPILGGIDLIRRMRSNPALARLPVIVLSTRGSDEDKRTALAVGADAYLVKTEFSEKMLKSVVLRQLGSAA